jgi:hypothetical protein
VDEIMRIIEQQTGNAERFVELAALDVVKRGHDRDAPFPQTLRFGEPKKLSPVAAPQVGANEMLGRTVNEIPVVDARHAAQIELVDCLSTPCIASRILAHEDEQSEQALLVPSR